MTVKHGDRLGIIGHNGAGKSTLFDILAGLREPEGGGVELDGRALMKWPAKERSRRISHLPQGTKQELSFTVEQMVLMGRYAYADRWFESDEDHAACVVTSSLKVLVLLLKIAVAARA